MSERVRIKYPVKIGFDDKSGRDENWITDDNDNVLVNGWGDCCRIGGIQEKKVAKMIVKLLNEHKPIMYFKKEKKGDE